MLLLWQRRSSKKEEISATPRGLQSGEKGTSKKKRGRRGRKSHLAIPIGKRRREKKRGTEREERGGEKGIKVFSWLQRCGRKEKRQGRGGEEKGEEQSTYYVVVAFPLRLNGGSRGGSKKEEEKGGGGRKKGRFFPYSHPHRKEGTREDIKKGKREGRRKRVHRKTRHV